LNKAIALLNRKIAMNREKGFSKIVIAISSGSVAIGMSVMIISIAILFGFKDRIRSKILSFSGHIEVTKFSMGDKYQHPPMSVKGQLFNQANKIPEIAYLQPFIYKAAMVKNNEVSKGVLFKGIEEGFNTGSFAGNLLTGEMVKFSDSTYSKDILISQKLSDLLRLNIGDEPIFYFIQDPVRIRKLRVGGIYETGLEGFDENIVIGDIGLARRLNNWEDTSVGGVEIFLKNFEDIDAAEVQIFDLMDYSSQLELVSEKFPQLFEWLKLLDRNVLMIIVIILVVASFNMVSSLIVLIMEKTNLIGTLKSLGAKDSQVQAIFFSTGIRILLYGLVIGNGIGFGFCFLQSKFDLIPLDPANYYMDSVPIAYEWDLFLAINVLTIVVVSLCLYFPTMIIGRMNPIKAIKFS
jgi:lipoprotein-releasing system permease protein